jgi:hypothetical protein
MGKFTKIVEAAIEVLAKKPGGALPAATVPPKTLPTDEASRMARAREMGFDVDAYHYSRHADDITEFNDGHENAGIFNALGVHSGTQKAASDRAENVRGYDPITGKKEGVEGITYPLKLRGERELLGEDGKPMRELELSGYLSDVADRLGVNQFTDDGVAAIRDEIWKNYDRIPYINIVEDAESVSYISPPKNIRSRFAQFDPAKADSSDLLAYQPKVLERDATGRPIKREPFPRGAADRTVAEIEKRLPAGLLDLPTDEASRMARAREMGGAAVAGSALASGGDAGADSDSANEEIDKALNGIFAEYPALKDWGVSVIDSRGREGAQGYLEFYHPDESSSPNPGVPTIELLSPELKGQFLTSAIFGDMLHYAPDVNPGFSRLREQFRKTITPKQLEVDRRAYERAKRDYGEDRPFDRWFDVSRLDAYIRGYLAPDPNNDWAGAYTPEQEGLMERMRTSLRDPAKKDSANILAGLGVVGAGAALSQQDGFDYGALRNVAEESNGQSID